MDGSFFILEMMAGQEKEKVDAGKTHNFGVKFEDMRFSACPAGLRRFKLPKSQ